MKTSKRFPPPTISRRNFLQTAALAATAAASGFGRSTANGAPPPMAMAAGAAAVPGPAPLQAIDAHVCGLHFYSGHPRRQVIAHHYCSHYNKDMHQCVIYDSDQKNARLVGIEYIITAELFAGLPAGEKPLWHSHAYEVKSGQLTAPGLAAGPEQDLMQDLAGTYGKTWYTWQVDQSPDLPLGLPQLMMAFTADGQVDPHLLAERDQAQGVSTAEKKTSRADLVTPAILPGADAWQHGEAVQLQLRPVAQG
jgi:hypothetical protein